MGIKLVELRCPFCNAGISLNVKGKKNVFCPYCGGQIFIDNNEHIYTYKINKSEFIHERYTNDADMYREKRKYKENKRTDLIFIGFVVVLVLLCFAPYVQTWLYENRQINNGMVKVGQSSSEMEGKNYRTVQEELRSAGFKNIVTINLDDAIFFIQDSETIESVSIGGETYFGADEFFDPKDTVIISYH